jgi:CRISPR-associated protein Cas8a1/Csx13
MKMTIKLNAPGMTSLHKAGLAGLYMTLRTFDETNVKIKGLDWQLEPARVTLHWQDEILKAAFESLIAKSFRLDDEGFIRLTGLEPANAPAPTKDKKHQLYEVLLNSFLQFGPHRSKSSKRTLIYEVNDLRCWIKDFEPITWFVHQDAPDKFIDNKNAFRRSVEVLGWLYPGGVQRHAGVTLSESPELALALLYAPVSVIYYALRSRAKGRKARLAMVIPEIKDLELYAEVRQAIATTDVLEMNASSASDAALRFITFLAGSSVGEQLSEFNNGSYLCRVITFGIVSWNEKQKSRTYTRSVVSSQLHGLENYRKADAIFKNRWQRIQAEHDRKGNETKPERYFVITYSAREFIADNIAQGNIWYHNLATYMSGRESREQLSYERKELNEMVENASLKDEGDDQNERVFISVCHESWRRRLGKLGKRAMTENTSFPALVKKDAEKLRIALARSKNAETLRETVVDFWARAGANPALQGDGLINLLPLFNEKNWRKTRDLALLALISYKPQTPEEAEVLTTVTAIDEEGEPNE